MTDSNMVDTVCDTWFILPPRLAPPVVQAPRGTAATRRAVLNTGLDSRIPTPILRASVP